MISGFGSTLNQQWGLPLWAGYLIAVALAVGTAVMGLQGIVNIIGKIGPVVVTFLFLLGVIAAFRFFPHIPDGIVLIKSGQVELLQAGANPGSGRSLFRWMLDPPRGGVYGQHWQEVGCV